MKNPKIDNEKLEAWMQLFDTVAECTPTARRKHIKTLYSVAFNDGLISVVELLKVELDNADSRARGNKRIR